MNKDQRLCIKCKIRPYWTNEKLCNKCRFDNMLKELSQQKQNNKTLKEKK